MALFGRRSKADQSQPADEAFPQFTVGQADRFRALVERSLARAGITATVHADHARTEGGLGYGLQSLAATCFRAPGGEKQWPRLIRVHVEALRNRPVTVSESGLTREEVLARTYVRVIGSADVPPGTSYGGEIADGLTAILNLDQAKHVAWFADPDVKRYGPLDDLVRAGRENLRLVPFSAKRVKHNGYAVELLSSNSHFMASLIMDMPHVLSSRKAVHDPRFGVFVTVPTRDVLGYHVLRDHTAYGSLEVLAAIGATRYDSGVGSVSPDVYWWRPNRLLRVSFREGLEVTLAVYDDELRAVLDEISSDLSR